MTSAWSEGAAFGVIADDQLAKFLGIYTVVGEAQEVGRGASIQPRLTAAVNAAAVHAGFQIRDLTANSVIVVPTARALKDMAPFPANLAKNQDYWP